MSLNDNLSDMLARIRNALIVLKKNLHIAYHQN